MFRSLLGALCGFVVGYFVGGIHALSNLSFGRPDDREALFLAAILCGTGVLSGAIVGAVGDVLAFVRRLLPDLPRTGPVADYRELPLPSASRPPASDRRHS